MPDPDRFRNLSMPQPAPGVGGTPAFDMNAMLQAFAQLQQQQQQSALNQQQNFFNNTNALGATAMSNARPGGLTPQGDWDRTFGINSASNLSPQAILASQGPSAMNQWASFGNTPGAQQMQAMNAQVNEARYRAPQEFSDRAEGAINASQPMFRLHPSTLEMAGLQAAPYASGDYARANAVNVPQQYGPPVPQGMQLPKKPGMRKGSSFGMQATGNPRPGVAF